MSRYTLPLCSFSRGGVQRLSGINTGISNGRHCNFDEVYIPIQQAFYDHYGYVLPYRNKSFKLTLPNGKVLSAKMCQDRGKALQSNPNKELGEWSFNKLNISSGNTVTNQDLTKAGFYSVILEEDGNCNFSMDVCKTKNTFQRLMKKPSIFLNIFYFIVIYICIYFLKPIKS